jgi:hypothetical protein
MYTDNNINYKNKYLKYKNKYLETKYNNMNGGHIYFHFQKKKIEPLKIEPLKIELHPLNYFENNDLNFSDKNFKDIKEYIENNKSEFNNKICLIFNSSREIIYLICLFNNDIIDKIAYENPELFKLLATINNAKYTDIIDIDTIYKDMIDIDKTSDESFRLRKLKINLATKVAQFYYGKNDDPKTLFEHTQII